MLSLQEGTHLKKKQQKKQNVQIKFNNFCEQPPASSSSKNVRGIAESFIRILEIDLFFLIYLFFSVIFYFIFLINFYWCTVALQCCANFYGTAK